MTALAGLLAVTGCGGSPGGAAGGVQTLAKVDGHRAEMAMPPNTFAVLEVAYDADTAQRMWQDNVPADLPTQDGEPRDAGRYGDLSDVDFSREAVAVWSSGESGSCPARVSDVELDSGYLVVTEDDDSDIGGACTADYNSYRVLVVVDRADLPEPDALATTGVRIKDTSIGSQVLLSLYPVS
ncbi:hypothetical protein [Quadrisphaera granulorum]|uniref:hypothetical protein n=1 Tax=Quadrisphaera granulorum TaxID=317664 RepID=UPI0011B51458|nr:hypothetical protein [Quadrisphaera granulorum]